MVIVKLKMGSKGVEYKTNLKRCETIDEREARWLKEDPNGCEIKMGSKGVLEN